MDGKRFSVAVIGLGWWGPKLLRNFRRHPAVRGVAGVDLRPEVCEQMSGQYGVPATTDLMGSLRGGRFHAVVVATPPQTHFDIAREALLSGCHVLLTKPPVKSLVELVELVRLAERKKLVLMMDSTFVYSSHLAKVKELLDSRLLTDIRFVQSVRYGNDMHMHHVGRIRDTMFANKLDVIEDLYFHDAAILTYLFGADFRPVSVQRHRILHPEFCDTAFIRLETDAFETHVGLSWTLPERRRELLVYGSGGYLKFDDLAEEPKITCYELESKTLKTYALEAREPLFNVVDHFLGCIASGAAPATNGSYMISLMENVEAVRNK